MSTPARTFITGASLVLPDRIASGQTLVVEGDRIAEIVSGPRVAGTGEVRRHFDRHFIVPGFVDVHVHGVAGVDVLDGPGAVAEVAGRLPRWGVTAFCPTSIACAPEELDALLSDVAARRAAGPAGARVLPAHLESNFISPEYHGAQPLACLRTFRPAARGVSRADGAGRASDRSAPFTAQDLVDVYDRHRSAIGIVTLAPEIEGGLDLVRELVAGGIHVSLGHSGASFEEAGEAIALGAQQATHLFNRMRPMSHRDPGLVGAVLAHEEVTAELVCDGQHVHPGVMRVAIAAKTPSRIMAITDGTAGSGLAPGSIARLGGQSITVAEVARLADGTIAGSVLTMDRAFACLVTECGIDLVQAAVMCATTPARALRLHGFGVIAPGAVADFVVLDQTLTVVETWVGGVPVWTRESAGIPARGTLNPDLPS